MALAGVDLIAPDVALPLEESGGMVNEINTTPGLHHHVLVSDPAAGADVGVLVLDRLLSTGSRRPQRLARIV